jgi:mevalonate pyrophosphate decarboxylase
MKFAMIVTFTMFGLLIAAGCLSTEQQTQVTSTIETVVDAAIPVAAQLGTVAAQAYVSGQVSEGNLTTEQAQAINSAIGSVSSSFVAAAVGTATAETAKDVKSPSLSKSVRNRVIDEAIARLK